MRLRHEALGWLGSDACQARWAGGGSRAANGQRTCWAVKGSAPCDAMALGSAGGCGWRAGACASPASSAWVRHQAQGVCVSSLCSSLAAELVANAFTSPAVAEAVALRTSS